MNRKPSARGANGRDKSGRFTKGYKGGPGNPYGRRVAALRSALLHAVTEDDLREVVTKLVDMAKGGDIAAIKELLNRAIGKPAEAVDPDAQGVTAARAEIDRRFVAQLLLESRLGPVATIGAAADLTVDALVAELEPPE